MSLSATGEFSNQPPIPWPFYFANPAVDNFKSVFDPSLLGIDVPIKNEGENFSVLSLGWTPYTDKVLGDSNQFHVGLGRRQLVGANSALDYEFGFTDVLFAAGISILNYRLNLGSEIQITDFLWIKPEVSANILSVPDYSIVIGNLKYTTISGTTVDYPLSVEVALNPHKTWGVSLGYSLHWLGRTNGSWDQQYYFGSSVNY